MNADMEAHERRLVTLETQMGDMRVLVSRIDSDLQQNTEVTSAIKRDTAEIVELMKGGKVFGKFVAWVCGLGVAVIGFYHLFVK